jgi:hypothetical protein
LLVQLSHAFATQFVSSAACLLKLSTTHTVGGGSIVSQADAATARLRHTWIYHQIQAIKSALPWWLLENTFFTER